jgi:hypothetical protein
MFSVENRVLAGLRIRVTERLEFILNLGLVHGPPSLFFT